MPSNGRWVATWAAAPAPAEGVVGFNNHTKRNGITPEAEPPLVQARSFRLLNRTVDPIF